MHDLTHLLVREFILRAGAEWMDVSASWRFVRVHAGDAYWLGPGQARSLSAGEVLVLPPSAQGVIRASRLTDVVLQGFRFAPDLLCGFFTLEESHIFQSGDKFAEVSALPSTHPIAQRFAEVAAEQSRSQSLAHRIEMLGLAMAVLDERIPAPRPLAARPTSTLHRFKQIFTQMPDTEIINHPPHELARLCGCSPRHFNRLFRENFGASARARQTELRLLKARQLLRTSDVKIVEIALECGYRSLSLFNTQFKQRFAITPSGWRRKTSRKNGAARAVLLALAATLLTKAPIVCAGENASATPKTNAPTFEVKGYQLEGNTLLPEETTELVLSSHTGPALTFDDIRAALADLQMTYRERGFVTAAVGLPPQQLTNGIVKVRITEGRLAEITIRGNHHFSSNNILRALPCLQTNTILNGLVLQQQLDRANANRDRQIYPQLSPGAEPGTSALELKVKDRLPLHARFQLNNYATPDSPDLRMNLSGVANNLWQREHQLGVQYSFSPTQLKDGDFNFYDKPLIASYSAFYRLPFGPVNGAPREYSLADFGYDEVTRRFRPPAILGARELLVYASRSSSDTDVQLQSENLTPATLPPDGGLQVSDKTSSRSVNANEDVGFRFIQPLPKFGAVDSSLSLGLDFKNYRNTTAQSRVFQATLYIPQVGADGTTNLVAFPSQPQFSGREIFTSVEYLPLTMSFDASAGDHSGATSFNLSQSFNLTGPFSGAGDFQAVAGSTNTGANYYVLTAGLTREQKIYRDWGVRLHADGQWASQPLISNEQFGIGGLAGVRGYRDGEDYGDTGWRASFEPHSPYLNLGLVDNAVPMLVRLCAFVDYGERYLLDPGVRQRSQAMWGAGCGVDANIGEHFEFHFGLGVPLIDTPKRNAGAPRVSFSIVAQF